VEGNNYNLDFLNNGYKSIDLLSNVAKKYIPDKDVFPIGFPIFDDAMDGGLRGGELVVVSAPTGGGKTTIGLQITSNLINKGVPCLWFTFEMNPHYLNQKYYQIHQLENSPIYTPVKNIQMTMESIESLAEDAYKDYACKVIFIDHLHYLIPLMDAKNSSLMIGGIVRELKQIAIRQNLIVLLIAHTKKIYQGEKVDLSSIRDSSLIAQEADYVILLDRKRKEEKKSEVGLNDTEWLNETKISIAKNRRTGEQRFITCKMQNHKFVEMDNRYNGYEY
jgi:replicative DNA helicase